jgi:hypothetical protein
MREIFLSLYRPKSKYKYKSNPHAEFLTSLQIQTGDVEISKPRNIGDDRTNLFSDKPTSYESIFWLRLKAPNAYRLKLEVVV